MIQAQCHCGNIKISINDEVESVTSCNCSVCNRLGALWGYFSPQKIEIHHTTKETALYRWGDETIDFHHCPICGCTTHYTPTTKGDNERMAVNFRMVDLEVMNTILVRHFDGVDTWKYINS